MVPGFGHGTALGLLFAVLVLICESLFSLPAIPLLPKFGELRVSALLTVIAVPVLLIAGLATDGAAMLRVPSLAGVAVVVAGILSVLARA